MGKGKSVRMPKQKEEQENNQLQRNLNIKKSLTEIYPKEI